MSVAHALLAGQRDEAMNLVGLNSMQARAIFDPSPQVDSLAEHAVSLRRFGVPESTVQAIMGHTRDLLSWNTEEGEVERDMVAVLDDMATSAHAAARPTAGGARAVTVKQLAALVRAAQDADDLSALVAEHPRHRLMSRGVLGEIGAGRSRRLMAELGPEPSR